MMNLMEVDLSSPLDHDIEASHAQPHEMLFANDLWIISIDIGLSDGNTRLSLSQE